MHCQTKRYSGLFFLFLFILNFKSLNTESNSFLNSHPKSHPESHPENHSENVRNEEHSSKSPQITASCPDCSPTVISSTAASSIQPTAVSPSNSSLLAKIIPAFHENSGNRDVHTDDAHRPSSSSRSNSTMLRSFDRHSITFRSTPNFVLLPDSPFATMQIAKQSRKKQLDLELEPVNMKSDLNYRLDESQTETRAEDAESEEAKGKLKQNVDAEESKDSKEIKDIARDKETDTERKLSPQIDDKRSTPSDRHLTRQTEMQPDKQVERQANGQSDKRSDEKPDRTLGSRPEQANSRQQPTDQQPADKQFKQEATATQHRLISERRNESRNNEPRNRRLNEHQIRRLKHPSRQPAQSNFSILRRYYPTQNQLQINANRYTVEDARLATLEIVKVQREGKCKAPAKRVIPIYQLLNNSHQMKRFLPHCTILHRCESETGCCNSESEQCSVKKQEPVRLPFWVISLSADGQQFKTIEWFTFHNHTECECRTK